jgi:hypothetical protein
LRLDKSILVNDLHFPNKKNIESIRTEKTINENYGINLNNKRIDFSYKNEFEKEEKMR